MEKEAELELLKMVVEEDLKYAEELAQLEIDGVKSMSEIEVEKFSSTI
jgi:hypothetical protein